MLGKLAFLVKKGNPRTQPFNFWNFLTKNSGKNIHLIQGKHKKGFLIIDNMKINPFPKGALKGAERNVWNKVNTFRVFGSGENSEGELGSFSPKKYGSTLFECLGEKIYMKRGDSSRRRIYSGNSDLRILVT